MAINLDLSQIISDGLTWDTFKYIGKLAIGAVLMTGAGQYLLDRVFNRLKKKQEKIAYWIGAPIFIFAFFLFVSASGNQAAAPALNANIEAIYTTYPTAQVPQSPRTLVLVETLTNSGSMASIGYAWRVSLKHGTQIIDCPTTGFPEIVNILLPARGSIPQRTVTYYSKDSLMVKALTPIVPGGLITGLLVCDLGNVDVDHLTEGDEVTVSFLDVFQRSHVASLKGSSQYIDIKIFPGVAQEVK